ncbi:MAG: hypothetical protein AB7I41_08560 [Candidatus Sericytochromatia bacterium]
MSLIPASPQIKILDPARLSQIPSSPPPLPPSTAPIDSAQGAGKNPIDPASTAHREDSVALGEPPSDETTATPTPVSDDPAPQLTAVKRYGDEGANTPPSQTRLSTALRVAEKANLGSEAGKQQAASFAQDVQPIVTPIRQEMGVASSPAAQPPPLPSPPAGQTPAPTQSPPSTPVAPVAPVAIDWKSKTVGSLNLTELAALAKLTTAADYPANLAEMKPEVRQLAKIIFDGKLATFLQAAPAKVTVPAEQKTLADNLQKLITWGGGSATLKAYAAILPKALELDPAFKTHLTESASACLTRPFVDALNGLGIGALLGDPAQLTKMGAALDVLIEKGLAQGLADAAKLNPDSLDSLHTLAKILEGQKADPKLSLVPEKLVALLKTFPTEAPKVAALEKRMAEVKTKLAPYDKYFSDANFGKLTGAMRSFYDGKTDMKDALAIYSLIDFMGLTQENIKTVLTPLGLSPQALEAMKKSKMLDLLFAKPGSETHKLLPNMLTALQTLSDEVSDAKDFQAAMTLVTSGLFAVDALEGLAPSVSSRGVIRELVEMARRGTISQVNIGAVVGAYNTLTDKGVSLDSAEALLKLVGDLKLPPEDIMRFLRLAKDNPAMNRQTFSLVDRALAHKDDFSKFLGHQHKVPPFLLDGTGKTLSFEKFLKIEGAMKSLNDGKFDEGDLSAVFTLASMAPYDKIKDLIPAHIAGRFPALPKLLSDTKGITGFLASNLNFQKAFLSFLNGDATALVKALPGVAKGVLDVTKTNGSVAAFVQIFDLGFDLETKLIAAAETGNIDGFSTLSTEMQTKITATNARLQESVKRHPEIKTAIQATPTPAPASPIPAKAEELLTQKEWAKAEELALLKDPTTGPKLAKLQELQTLEGLQKTRPFFEEEALKLKGLSEELQAELPQLKRLQEVKTLQSEVAGLLSKEPFLKDNQLNAELVGLLESKLGGQVKESLPKLKFLQGVAGSNFETLLKDPHFDAIANRLGEVQTALIAQGVPPAQSEALLKKALTMPEFKPESLLKALDEQMAALTTLSEQLGGKLGDIKLTPQEMLKSLEENLPGIRKSLEGVAQGRDLKHIENLMVTLFDDPRFLDQGKLKPEVLTSLLQHLEKNLAPAGSDLGKLVAQLETLHLLGPDALEKMLKLPPDQLAEALPKLTAYADYAKQQPAILQRGVEKVELKAALEELIKVDPLKIPTPKVLAEVAGQNAELKQASGTLRELLVKSGLSDEKEIAQVLGGFESYLKTIGNKAEDLAAVQKGLDYLKNLPPEAIKGLFSKDFHVRILGPEMISSLNTVVDKLGKAGYSGPNIQKEVIETLKKGVTGIHELSKQAKVLTAAEDLLGKLDPELLKDAAQTRELHAQLRKSLAALPEIHPEHLAGLKVAIEETKRLDVVVGALAGLRPADLEQVAKQPEQFTPLMKKYETLMKKVDQAWGKVVTPPAVPKPGTLNNAETRAAVIALLRNDRFWENSQLMDQEVEGILRQLSQLEGDPVTANGLVKALGGMSDIQSEKAMWELLRQDKNIFKDVQTYTKEMEKLLLKTEGLKPEEVLKARATFFEGLSANIVKNLERPAFFQEQLKLAELVSSQLKGLPFKLTIEAQQEVASSFLRIANDPHFLTGATPDPAKVEAALKLLSEKLGSLKDSPAQLQDVIRGLREFSESRYISEGLANPDLIKGYFFEDLGKTVKTMDHASGDLGHLLSKSPLIIQKYLSIHGAKVAYKEGQALLDRASSKEFETIPGTNKPHPHSEYLKLLAIAGYGVNSVDALTSFLEIGGVELMGLGKQMAMAGTEFGIDLLINYYLNHPEQAMPQKFKDLIKSTALASALTSDQAFATVQKLYPEIKDRGDLVVALGESLATQDNIQLMSTSLRYYFQQQVLSLNGKGLDGVVLDKVMQGLEKIAGYGGEMANAVGQKLASWAHDLAGTSVGKASLARLEGWITTAGKYIEGKGQALAGHLEAAMTGLSDLAKWGNEGAIKLLSLAGTALETMGEGLMKQKFVQGMVNAVEGASSVIKSGMLSTLSGINSAVAKYGSPTYDAIRITLQKAGILAPIVKTEAKLIMQGAEFAGDAGKLEKAVARGLVGLEEVAAKKGLKTLTETLKLFKTPAYAEQFLELLAKLPPGMAEKILQSESLMAMLPKMLGRMFDVGMTAEKIAVKFTAAMGKIMPLVGIGVSSYDAYRLHTIATTGEWGGTKYDHPDVRALALVGSFVNGADTAMSVAELLLDIPSGGGASLALLGASAFMALTELGLDLMIDYYNGPPPVPMGETMRSSVRAAATACAALDPTISMEDIYTFGSITTGQDLGLQIEALKGQPPTPAQQKSLTDRLAGQLANNQLGEAELIRTLVDEFVFANGTNVALNPEELGKIVGPEFLKLALKMLLSDFKSSDVKRVEFLLKAAPDKQTADQLKSSWIEKQGLRGEELLTEIALQFGLDIKGDTGNPLAQILNSEALKALSPSLQKQLLEELLSQAPPQMAGLAQRLFAAGDESVKLAVLAKLPPVASKGFVTALGKEDLTFIQAYQSKDPTGAVLGKLFDSLLLMPEPLGALEKLLVLAPAATQAKLLEKILANASSKTLAAQLVLKVSDRAALELLPMEKIAKAATPEGGKSLYAHVLQAFNGAPPGGKALSIVAENIPFSAVLQFLNERLNLDPPHVMGTIDTESSHVHSLLQNELTGLKGLDQNLLLRFAHILAQDGSMQSMGDLSRLTATLDLSTHKQLLSELLAQSDKAPNLAIPIATLIRNASQTPEFGAWAKDVDLSKAAALLAKTNDTSGLSHLLSGLIRGQDVPPEKFAAIIAQLEPGLLVGTLNQLPKEAIKALFDQLSDDERLTVFKQVVAAQKDDFTNGMGYARILLNIPDGATLKEAGTKFKLPANASALMDVLSSPDLLGKLSESNGGAEVVSWIVAFGDRGQNEKAFEFLQKSNSWLKDHSDVLVAAFELADKGGLSDADLKGKLSAKALYFMTGPLNSGADALAEWLGANKEFSQNMKLLERLANLTDSEGKAALINGLLDNKTYDLLLVSWNAEEVEGLIDRIYNQDPSAALIVHIEPSRFQGRFSKHADDALLTVLKSKEVDKDSYLAKLTPLLSPAQIRTFVTQATPEELKTAQNTLLTSFNKLDPAQDGELIVKLAQAANTGMRSDMVRKLLGTTENNALTLKVLQKTVPVAELLDRLDMGTLATRFKDDPAHLQGVLDLVEKSGKVGRLKEFIEGLPASALLESLAYDAGISDFKPTGDLQADIAKLLSQTDLKGLGYSVAPHMDKLFRELKASKMTVGDAEITSLVKMAGYVSPADRAKLLQGVLAETVVDDADAALLEGVLKAASPADFKAILENMGEKALKSLGAEVAEASDSGLMIDLMQRLAASQDLNLFNAIIQGAAPGDLVKQLSAMPPDKQTALLGSLSEKQYLSLGQQVLKAADKAALDLFARMIGQAEGTAFPQKDPALRGQMLSQLADQLTSFSLSEGGDKALTWIIGLSDKVTVDKAFKNFKEGWANRADIVVSAIHLAKKEGVPLKERLSGDTLRLIMPNLNNSWDYLSSMVGSKGFAENMQLIQDLAALTDDKGKAHIVNGLIDKKTLDFFGLGYQAPEVKATIANLVGTSKSYEFVLNLDAKNVVAYFEPSKIADMLNTLAKSSEKGKDKAIQGIISAAQSTWGSKDLATTRAFISGFVNKMDAKAMETLPGAMRLMFDTLNSHSGTITPDDYKAMEHVSQGVDASTKKYMVMQMMNRWKNITDFVVSEAELKTAVGIIGKDPKGVIAQFSEAEIAELMGKFSGNKEADALIDLFEKHAEPAQLEKLLKQLPPEAILASLAKDSGLALSADADALKNLTALLAKGAPNTGYGIQTHLRVLISKLDLTRSTEAAQALTQVGDRATQVQVLKDLIPDAYYHYISTGDGPPEPIPNSLDAAQIKLINAVMGSHSGDIDTFIKEIGPELTFLAASGEYNNPATRSELRTLLQTLVQAKDHTALQEFVKALPPHALADIWEGLGSGPQTEIMKTLSDPDRKVFLAGFVKAGKIGPVKTMINGMDQLVGGSSGANRDVSEATKTEMLHLLSQSLGQFQARSQDMAEAGMLLVMNAPKPNQADPNDPANALLDNAFKSILDSGYFGKGAEAVKGIIRYTKEHAPPPNDGMALLAGKLSPKAMGYAADSLDSFWTWMTSNKGDAENVQFIKDLACAATPEGKAGMIKALLAHWTTDSREKVITDILVGRNGQQELKGSEFARMVNLLDMNTLSDELETPSEAGEFLAALIDRYPKDAGDLNLKVRQLFSDYSTLANSGAEMMASMLNTLEKRYPDGQGVHKALAKLDSTPVKSFLAYGNSIVLDRLRGYMNLDIPSP